MKIAINRVRDNEIDVNRKSQGVIQQALTVVNNVGITCFVFGVSSLKATATRVRVAADRSSAESWNLTPLCGTGAVKPYDLEG